MGISKKNNAQKREHNLLKPTQDFKLLSYLCYGVVYLCVAHLFTMIMKAENIDINSKNNKKRLVKKKLRKLEKEYRE